MKMSRFWWCKHFHLVYLFISLLLCGSFALNSSTQPILSGDLEEPTEEPEEHISSSGTTFKSSTDIYNDNLSTSIGSNSSEYVGTSSEEEASSKINGSSSSSLDEREEQDGRDEHARAIPYPSETMWKTASRFLHKGLRMFRESLLEGAKVAHMFKEDVDEGVQNIMRQNRGIKKNGGAETDQDKSSSSSGFYDSQMLREGVIGGILRFMGINSKQMGVIALNVLIILAEWITSSMIGSNEVAGATSRMIKTNLLQWASTGHNAQIENLLYQAKRHTLPEKLIDKLTEKTGNSTSCVQLLICKMSPVIWGFQDTLNDQMKKYGWEEKTPWRTAPKSETSQNENEADGKNSRDAENEPRGFFDLTQHLIDKFMDRLPPKQKIVDFGDKCEAKFPHCQLLKFGAVNSY